MTGARYYIKYRKRKVEAEKGEEKKKEKAKKILVHRDTLPAYTILPQRAVFGQGGY